MKKTFFIEIVYNNTGKTMMGTKYLRAVVTAKDKEAAAEKVLAHFRPHYTAGDAGRFHVQCNWQVHVPTREIIEKHWRAAIGGLGSVPDGHGGHHEFQADKTKKDALSTWDYCNSGWASPAVYYDPTRGGYMVAIHNHMVMPTGLRFFKGVTAETYKKAKQFVKDNTFQGDYYIPFK